jgi:hypothetical protein
VEQLLNNSRIALDIPDFRLFSIIFWGLALPMENANKVLEACRADPAILIGRRISASKNIWKVRIHKFSKAKFAMVMVVINGCRGILLED